MIWVWILAAVALSWLFCRKKVAWYHYIWLLLPIEMYGISVAGAMIKPYMLFGCLVILNRVLKRQAHKIPKGIAVVVFGLTISDILNGLIIASIMQHVMFLMIIYIAYSYTITASEDGDILNGIEIVTTATTIGYGLIFMFAYVVYLVQPEFGGVYCIDRYSTGMFLRFVSTGGITTVRLRGFCIDPNSVVTTLIPGASFALARLLYKKDGKLRSAIAVALYALVMYLSGSRMAVVCTAVMLVVMLIMGYKQAENKLQWLGMISMVVIFGIAAVVLRFEDIVNEVIGFFTMRAGLNDTAGRFTIWKSNFKWLSENGRLLLGVGQNQIANLATTGKACHNTWLEWICGTGILLGSCIDLWFFTAPIEVLRRSKYGVGGVRKVIPIVLTYVTALICITTVDNITNSIVLFLMVLFRYGNLVPFIIGYEEDEKDEFYNKEGCKGY